jgi:hypothetical protein
MHSVKITTEITIQIRTQAIQWAVEWHELIGTNDIETPAGLARYLGVSEARVTQVLNR